MTGSERREGLLELFRAGLDAVHAGRAVEAALVEEGAGQGARERWHLLAAGKAAPAMASAARRALGPQLAGGRVVAKRGFAESAHGLELEEAGHPVPDEAGVEAARRALELAGGLTRDDHLLVLLSGGASALWCAPVAGVDLAEKARLTDALLRAGSDIAGLNCVRKHLSRIKGGGLALAAAPAALLTLAVSDVPGDRPETIGSGPTAPDPTRYADALAELERAGIDRDLAPAAFAHLERGARGEIAETPGPQAECFARAEYKVVARLEDALAAIERAAVARGLPVHALGRVLDGEARQRAAALAERVSPATPVLLIAGGESTVTVVGDGRGGRAQEAALAFALAIEGRSDIAALFAGTDGSDGPTPAAGALVDGETLRRGRAAGADPRSALARNDSFRFLEAAGDLIYTGPTHTNVSDIALIQVG